MAGQQVEDTFDVIVLGGGPGGSALATLVAQQGHRVLLLERETFPRHQLGESLLPSTIHGVCAMLGVTEELDKANFPRKLGGSFLWGKRPEPWSFTFADSPVLRRLGFSHAYQVERAKFDEILLRNAQRKGVDVREQHVALEVLREGGRFSGVRFKDSAGRERVARACYVVDASGHRGSFHSHVGERVYSKFFRNVAVYGYFNDGKRLPAPRQGNILSAAFKYGWIWYIPLSEKLTSVGAVIGHDFVDKLNDEKETVLLEMIEACPIVKDLLSEATLVREGIYGEIRTRKDWSYENTSFWGPGMALIGDAACFIDPFFSSGVHLATYAALQAARAINTCLKGELDEKRCFDEFEQRYRKEYRIFYELLQAFYDLHTDEESYFWIARKILKSELTSEQEGTAPEAFLRLVAGSSQGKHDFHAVSRSRSGGNPEDFQQLFGVAEEQLGHSIPPEIPLFESGLVPSKDGFHWSDLPA
jgi:halogenation protein CepH